jgi:hypothetical protein
MRVSHRRTRSLNVGLCYMVINNPHDPLREHGERLTRLADPDQIGCLDRLLQDWNETTTLDYCPFLARFFACCGVPQVGFGNNAEEVIWSDQV